MYYVSRATLKTANKQFSSVKNDYEMTFNNDTSIELCTEDVDLPTMTFEFLKIDELEKRQANDLVGECISHLYGLNLMVALSPLVTENDDGRLKTCSKVARLATGLKIKS